MTEAVGDTGGLGLGDFIMSMLTENLRLESTAANAADRILGEELLTSLRRKAVIEALQDRMAADAKSHAEQLKALRAEHQKTIAALQQEITKLKEQQRLANERAGALEERVNKANAAYAPIYNNVIRLIQEAAAFFAAGGVLDHEITELNASEALDPEYTGAFYKDQPKPKNDELNLGGSGAAGKSRTGKRRQSKKR